mgnify:FL=1
MRSALTLAASFCAVAACFPSSASAQAYPNKSVKSIVGFPAGGGSDALARLMSAALSDKLGQN